MDFLTPLWGRFSLNVVLMGKSYKISILYLFIFCVVLYFIYCNSLILSLLSSSIGTKENHAVTLRSHSRLE